MKIVDLMIYSKLRYLLAFVLSFVLIGCTISYKFNGTVIDYDKIKTIAIEDFTNHAAMVYAPLTSVLNEKIKDTYTRQTRLSLVDRNGDLELSGEVVGYDVTPMGMTSNS